MRRTARGTWFAAALVAGALTACERGGSDQAGSEQGRMRGSEVPARDMRGGFETPGYSPAKERGAVDPADNLGQGGSGGGVDAPQQNPVPSGTGGGVGTPSHPGGTAGPSPGER